MNSNIPCRTRLSDWALILAAPLLALSCDVPLQMREYERFNTTIVNAYIKPLKKSYLDRSRGRMADVGAPCPIFLMHSCGGIISLENTADAPTRLVESGSTGCAIVAADIAARHGVDKVLSFDMGGTKAKICLIKKQTQMQYQVMWNRLISVVQEQAQALVPIVFSTSARDVGDLSAGV